MSMNDNEKNVPKLARDDMMQPMQRGNEFIESRALSYGVFVIEAKSENRAFCNTNICIGDIMCSGAIEVYLHHVG